MQMKHFLMFVNENVVLPVLQSIPGYKKEHSLFENSGIRGTLLNKNDISEHVRKYRATSLSVFDGFEDNSKVVTKPWICFRNSYFCCH